MEASGAGRGSRAPEPGGAFSIGRFLASQRRLRGISLDELAARTRIPRRNLERLEAGAFDTQSDGFVRGFVRTVADALGLDADETVMRLAQEPSSADEEWLRRRRRRAIWVVAALAAGVLALGVVAVRLGARWLASPGPDPSAAWVYRRDAVRALAEERAEALREEAAGGEDAAASPVGPAGPAGPAPPGPERAEPAPSGSR